MAKEMTDGKPLKLILAFTLPMLIGNIFQQFYAMVDTVVVGQFIGVQALAAVGATGGITFFVLGFILGLANGFAIIVSHRFGSHDDQGLRQAVGNSIILSVIFGVLVTILSVACTGWILRLLQTPSDIIDASYRYLVVIFAGTCASLAYNLIASILRALGDSKTPLIFLVVASVINVILDLVFIVNLKMGVEGTAYATILSQGLSFVLCFLYTKKKYPILHLTKADFKVDTKLCQQLLKIALPGALSSSITAFGVMVLQGTINQLGSDIVAAYTAGTKVEQFFTMPTMTLGMALATFAGQNLGAAKIDRVKQGVQQSLIITLAYSIIGGALLYVLGEPLTRLFVSADSVAVIEASCEYLRIIAIFCWLLAILFLYRSTIQGLGNGFVPMLSGAIELVMRVVAALVLSQWLDFMGVCLASPIAWLGADFLLVPYYHRMLKKLFVQFEKKIVA